LSAAPATLLPMPLEIVQGLGLDRVLFDCRHGHPLVVEFGEPTPFLAAAASLPATKHTKPFFFATSKLLGSNARGIRRGGCGGSQLGLFASTPKIRTGRVHSQSDTEIITEFLGRCYEHDGEQNDATA
jgi:hypothetical protein